MAAPAAVVVGRLDPVEPAALAADAARVGLGAAATSAEDAPADRAVVTDHVAAAGPVALVEMVRVTDRVRDHVAAAGPVALVEMVRVTDRVRDHVAAAGPVALVVTGLVGAVGAGAGATSSPRSGASTKARSPTPNAGPPRSTPGAARHG